MSIDGARAEAGPGVHLVGVIGSPIAPFTVALAAQRRLRRARAGGHLALPGLRGGARSGRGALAAMRRADISGLSVTMPHKADVATLVDECSEVARRLGAVNCIVNRDGRLLRHEHRRCRLRGVSGPRRGLHPGGPALPRDRRRRGGPGRGAGPGRGRGQQVAVLNRTPERAAAAAALAGAVGSVVSAEEGARDEAVRFADLVVNATPLGMAGASPEGATAWLVAPQLLHAGQVAADLVYVPRPTPWLAGRPLPVPSRSTGSACWSTRRRPSWCCGRGSTAPVEAMWQAARPSIRPRPPASPRLTGQA